MELASPVIRKATREHTPAIARVHIDSWRTTYRDIIPEEHLARPSYEERENLRKKAIADPRQLTLALALVLVFPLVGCGPANRTSEALPAPRSSPPSDRGLARRHVQIVTQGRETYRIVQGGALDGENCRSPVGTWQGWEQVWESNRSVRMENVGENNVRNPWLTNGRQGCRSVPEILASVLRPGMTEREKALALYAQERRERWHVVGDRFEVWDPVKVRNIYGYNTCGNDSISLACLWKAAGLAVAPARLVGHCVSQAFFDGRWHVLDADMQGLYLLRDGITIAGEEDIVADHDLVKRTHTEGILHPGGRSGDEREASLYVCEGKVAGSRGSPGAHRMELQLRPDEALVWCWGHPDPPKVHGAETLQVLREQEERHGVRLLHTIADGRWEYRPDFRKPRWRKGADRVAHVVETPEGLAAEEGKSGLLEWTLQCPYVLVGGRLEVEGGGAEFSTSWDGETWTPCGAALDALFPAEGEARYGVHLRCRLAGGARLRNLGIVLDLQMAPLALPGMRVGENCFTYSDESTEPRQIRLTHEWVERSDLRPPLAPAAACSPPDGGESDGTQILFSWEPSPDPGGRAIADYEFELSDDPGIAWPLSSNFSRLVSLTADRGSSQYCLPEAGLLAPDRTYYWHVRAKNDQGVWSGWSRTWSFTARGPAVPTDVRLEWEPGRERGILRWSPNSAGRRPIQYRIYGSDERGFSARDLAYPVNVGISKELPSTFPGNFAEETKTPELEVVGVGLRGPNRNRSYYRVVAVDAQGRRSAPSSAAEAPRPFLYSAPVTQARVGEPYRYAAASIRSLGDLKCKNPGEVLNFWDIEHPRYVLLEGPAWLRIDAVTGVLSGVPDAAGSFPVTLAARIELEIHEYSYRQYDETMLPMGRDQVARNPVGAHAAAKQVFLLKVEN